ncbi:hypothetical protein chiPu_0012739 [Chiloscyllium punctatum]|uniref:Uncharacterized protein n=1 Tax=Chiloscyllium punctatum TaxID=137246 RepID=A0A401SV98_CHIPU|nr:hypothetical protein [Chiloscyllium punctatum]
MMKPSPRDYSSQHAPRGSGELVWAWSELAAETRAGSGKLGYCRDQRDMDSESQLNQQRTAVLLELNNILTTTRNLVCELRTLVALTDREGGKLIQSQNKAESSLDIWKQLFAAVPSEENAPLLQ